MKIIFKKPPRRKILIFDRNGLDIFKFFFHVSTFEVLDRRKESINIYVVIITIINHGLKNFKTNYFKEYLQTVQPKVILTFIDNNFRFFLLKKIFPTAKYICFQNGMRDSKYFSDLKKFKQINNQLIVDYYFCFSNLMKQKLCNFIDAKFYCIGSILNNHFYKKKNISSSSNVISFVSQYKNSFRLSEKIVLKFLSGYCQRNNLQLNIVGKINKLKVDNFHNDIGFKGNWKFFTKDKVRDSYDLINRSGLVVYIDSTLGYEALAKGIKVISLPFGSLSFKKNNTLKNIKEQKWGFPYITKNSGYFWSNYYLNNRKLDFLFNKILNCSRNKWNRIYRPYKKTIMNYDKNNSQFKRILHDLLKN